MRFIVLATALLANPYASSAVEATAPSVQLVYDFVSSFSETRVQNSTSSSAGRDERSGGVSKPGIFLHTKGQGDSIAHFPGVVIPDRQQSSGSTPHALPSRPFLVFHEGLRDGIEFTGKRAANGVRFSIVIDGELVYAHEHLAKGWRGRAIDLGPWQGRTVDIELRTNAIDGHTSYDWAIFGDPVIALMPVQEAPPDTSLPGMAVLEVECETPGIHAITWGQETIEIDLVNEKSWIPVEYQVFSPPSTTAASVTINTCLAAPYTAQLDSARLELSSPVVIAGEPFDIHYRVTNMGRGTHPGGDELRLAHTSPSASFGMAAAEERTLPAIPARETSSVSWRALVAEHTGGFDLSVGDSRLHFHVFPPAPAVYPEHPSNSFAQLDPATGIAAVVGNGRSRISFVKDGEDAYGILESWNGAAWQRSGSIYPLAQLHFDDDRPTKFHITNLAEEGGGLIIEGRVEDATSAAWPIHVRFIADSEASLIRIESEVQAPQAGDVSAFYGPVVLAGDSAYKAVKDFAIFPGLEYLEGSEPSSSTRDLAYPLSDRRVPARHKITTPLMAVQGEGALVALLWDMRQKWAADEAFPAARFLAPAVDAGQDYSYMALFAPSVGDYVDENAYEAFRPYAMETGEVLRLKSTLVLDHRANYAPGSLVHDNPHEGSLVLQAMRHWFDEFGFPAPSDAPRSWEEERALSRDAYANAVWSDEPPGWRHCEGWEPGLFVGHAVPQLLDLAAGMPEEDAKAAMGRINRVLQQAIDAHGPGYLWTGAGCHIMSGELPFYYGSLAESLSAMRDAAFHTLDGRQDGLWVWRPTGEKYAGLGISGDHTLGQAASPSWRMLRAARLSGDANLRAQALDAMEQMKRYDVPRGAQMWECPLYQPDILASAQAIRAYCEAYRLTGDEQYLGQARYWAWTGLPFIYFWDMDGYPTMRYNVVSVIGSTFYTHSWLGLPVVWCGLVYAYALQDLAEFDASFDWPAVAEGITRSAMWQQYTEGPSKGCYPDSWNMIRNGPNPADINPENILVNAFRLRGEGPDINCVRLDDGEGPIFVNSPAKISQAEGHAAAGQISFTLTSHFPFDVSSVIAPAPRPKQVHSQNGGDAGQLQWQYADDLKAITLTTSSKTSQRVIITFGE